MGILTVCGIIGRHILPFVPQIRSLFEAGPRILELWAIVFDSCILEYPSLYHSCSQFSTYNSSWGLAHAWALANHIATMHYAITSHRTNLVMVTKYSTDTSDSINMTRCIWKQAGKKWKCSSYSSFTVRIASLCLSALLGPWCYAELWTCVFLHSIVTTNFCIGILNPEMVK